MTPPKTLIALALSALPLCPTEARAGDDLRILLVRHGASAFNPADPVTGATPVLKTF